MRDTEETAALPDAPPTAPASPAADRPVRLRWPLAVVALAGLGLHLFRYFERKPEVLVDLLTGGYIRPSIWRSFGRNGAAHVAAAVAVWLLVAWILARRRRQPLAATLGAVAWPFAALLAFLPLAFLHFWPALREVSFLVYATALTAFVLAMAQTFGVGDLRLPEARAWRRRPAFWALALALLFVAELVGASFYRFANLRNHIDDLGLYDQMCWGLIHGQGFLNTVYRLPGDTFLAEHIMPTAAVIAQFYRLWENPGMLILLQSIFLAAGAWLVWRIARERTASALFPMVLTVSYAINPLVQRGWIDDFHMDSVEVFLYLAVYWCFLHLSRKRLASEAEDDAHEGVGDKEAKQDAGRPAHDAHKGLSYKSNGWAVYGYWAAIALLLGCKEDVGLSVAVLGLVLAMAHRRHWRMALASSALGLAYSYVAITKVLPYYASFGGAEIEVNRQIANYAHLGGDLKEIALASFLHPVRVLRAMLMPERVVSVLKILMPVGFLPLAAPLFLLLLAPPYLTTILSGWSGQYALDVHYGLVFVAPACIAAIEGWRHLERWLAAAPARRPRLALLGVACLACLAADHFREYPLTRPLKWRREFRSRIDREELLKIHDELPAAAALSVDEGIGPHFTHRRYVYKFPDRPERVRYILLYLEKPNPLGEGRRWEFRDLVRRLVLEEGWGIRKLRGETLLLQKGFDPGDQQALLAKVESKIRR